MGKCANCGCLVEEENLYYVKLDWQKEYSDQILCDLCIEARILKNRIEYLLKYNKALSFAKKRKWYIEVSDGEGSVERFEIENEFMSCVDVIRERMKNAGLDERWMDIENIKIKGHDIEIVSYLYFSNSGWGEHWVEIPATQEKSFWISIKKPKFWLWG